MIHNQVSYPRFPKETHGRCRVCKLTQPRSAFKTRANGSILEYCIACGKVGASAAFKSMQKEREPINQAMVNKAKAKGCSYCPETDPVCLDFHHRDPSTKMGNIGVMVHNAAPWVLERELEKCIVICANCHRKIHARQRLFKKPHEQQSLFLVDKTEPS